MVLSGWEKHPVGKLCRSIVPGRNKPKVFDGNIPWVTTPEFSHSHAPAWECLPKPNKHAELKGEVDVYLKEFSYDS